MYVLRYPLPREGILQCRSIAHLVLSRNLEDEESREWEGPSDHQRRTWAVPGDRGAEEVSNRRTHRSYQIPFYPAAAASAPRIIIFIFNNAEAAAALLRNSIHDGTVAQKLMFLRSPSLPARKFYSFRSRPLHRATLCVRSNRPSQTQLNVNALIAPAVPTQIARKCPRKCARLCYLYLL